MRETLGDNVTLGAFLQGIVADLRRRIQAFFQVALLENLSLLVGVACPYAGETIGL